MKILTKNNKPRKQGQMSEPHSSLTVKTKLNSNESMSKTEFSPHIVFEQGNEIFGRLKSNQQPIVTENHNPINIVAPTQENPETSHFQNQKKVIKSSRAVESTKNSR